MNENQNQEITVQDLLELTVSAEEYLFDDASLCSQCTHTCTGGTKTQT